MESPTFGKGGYPTDETLEAIQTWPCTDQANLIGFVEITWNHDYGDIRHRREHNEYTFITGGWSGNESIIAALRGNVMFWAMFWQLSERGGRHVFIVP